LVGALFQNVTILIFIYVLYHFIFRLLKGKPWAISIISGIFLGGTAILAMLTPFQVEEGVFYDARSIVIGIAGFFGGPLTGTIAAALALAFRISLGGAGVVPGSLSIIFSMLLSTVAAKLRPRYQPLVKKHKFLTIIGTWFLGFLIHVCVVLSQFLLPEGRWHEAIPLMLFPFLVIFPVVFSLICLLFLDNERLAQAGKDLAESEARYRSLFQNHHTVMLILDPVTGSILDANPAAEAFYGWDRATLSTMHIQEINTLAPEEVEAEMARARLRNKSIFYFRHRRANAEPIDVEVYSGPISIHGRELLLSIIHDNSQRVRAEKELKALTETLEQQVKKRTEELEAKTQRLTELNREHESFVYSVSHDLRAPLRAIAGFSTILGDMLRESPPNATGQQGSVPNRGSEVYHLLERIQANAERMQKLINDMLMLSRVGTRAMNPQPIDLSLMAQEIIGEETEDKKERYFDCAVQKNLHAYADPDLARILLANLISNAIKFTQKQDIARIEIGSELHEGKEVFYIRDNGAGFDVEAAGDRLFAPFQRFHDSDEFEGTGIGLSIVRRVAMRHGGSVTVESAPGKGTSFYFDFGEAE
jgi:PAS domain S-box-containing protein